VQTITGRGIGSLTVFLTAFIFQVQAGAAFRPPTRDIPYNDYYKISQAPESRAVPRGNEIYNLLKWEKAGKPLPPPKEPYDRDKHFGGWIDDNRDKNCLNTRAKVLVQNTKKPVTYINAQKCVIATGEWLDPYTNRIFRNASDIQIDHFVPLKQAYITGAWTWTRKERCLYGNYLFNGFQLLAVNGTQNQIKSDRAPNEYMPPNKALWCSYLSNWLKVKFLWNLVMTPPEAQGIAEIFKVANCQPEAFKMTMAELAKQRGLIKANYNYCDFDGSSSQH